MRYKILQADFGADAVILADFSGFYIDGEIFDRIDLVRGAQLSRLRFVIAYELGHLFLHREYFEAAGILTSDHLLDWLNEHNGRKYDFERDANEFAGRLLVPVDMLRECFTGYFPPWMPSMEGTLGWPTPSSAAKRRS